MGNCECIELGIDHPMTTERLERAVRENDTNTVQHLLANGVQVNSPIDDDDHTVMDVLVKQQQLDLDRHHRSRVVSGDDGHLTDCLTFEHKKTAEMLNVLLDAGGKVSAKYPDMSEWTS
eukprot:TRINITY_DN38791_c0_g1_i1.p1 TRINITY_DN38791_c0_g1~~TRINITY_DN38791_c0_g1_i1.p1  ORF type:complete len:119 (-),score=25.43 TRINITY_DN38791_c0_g1_i1:169-525(-)